MKTSSTDSDKKEKKDKNAMKESLMLPCTSAGKTTSASIAEKSNVWAENKLLEKKSVLDEKLHKSIVKMNTNKLEIVHELTKLRKSASTGALERLNKQKEGRQSQLTHTDKSAMVKSSSKTSVKSDHSQDNKISEGAPAATPHTKTKSETLLKQSDSRAKISITLGGDSSSDDDTNGDGNGENHIHDHKHTFSVTACPFGRECSSHRSELRKFENATKRYTRLLSPKPKNGK
jgi:hypothetical protein